MFFASKESSLRLPTRDALTVGWLEAMCPLIAGEVKERAVLDAGRSSHGRPIQRIQRASAGQGPIAEQINRAKLHIRAQSFKHIFANDVTDDKPVPNGLFQIYQLTDPIAIISLSIDGMQRVRVVGTARTISIYSRVNT